MDYINLKYLQLKLHVLKPAENEMGIFTIN